MWRGLSRLKFLVILIVGLAFAQTGGRYLVITPDAFYNNLQPLIEWKYRKGLSPIVYRLSQIGSDSISIKNFIRSAYLNWDVKPQYVVLIGHGGYVPMCYYNYGGYSYYTDNYYANMDGDIYNELTPGRISVSNTTELDILISKILKYERTPDMSDTSWFIRGVAMANCDGTDDSTYLHAMRYAESLAVSSGFDFVDTLCNYYGHNVNNLMNSINAGRSFVLYRGNANNHWYDPFNIYPLNLNNGNKLPVVISTTCRTVSPNASAILGENFVRTGSISVPKGAAGFFGGTRNTSGASHLRNAVAIGFLDAMFAPNKLSFGEISEAGRLRVYQQYGDLREYNNFTCIGDPDMNIWSDVPCSLIVSYPSAISPSTQIINILVQHGITAVPIPNATVCLAGKLDSSVYCVDTTDINGGVSFTINPGITGDTIWVTVTGKNLKPHEGFIPVNPMSYAFIMYYRSEINDTIAGNNDGYINPGEEIEMPVWVYNVSESTGVGIQGQLSENSVYVTLLDSVRTYGDVPGLDSAITMPDGFKYSVVRNCPNLQRVDFHLTCTDENDSTWQSDFYYVVLSPVLALDGRAISGGNGNGILEPGETVDLAAVLRNRGDAAAEDINIVLRSYTSGISLFDSIGHIDHIGIDSTGSNSSDLFVLHADSSVENGTIANFEMFITSVHQDDTIPLTLIVGQKDFYVWNADPTPVPGQNIYDILNNLGFTGDYGTSLPSDLELYQVLLGCMGVYPNRHLIVQNGSEALTITDFINTGGRVYLESSSAFYVDVAYYNGHNFGSLFGLSANTYTYGDLGPLNGQSGTFTNGMYFNYGGENAYMDHLNPTSGYIIFRDVNNSYYCGIAHSTATYRTVGVSFELGLLADGSPPSTREVLLDSIMRFFGVPAPGVTEYPIESPAAIMLEVYPNPLSKLTKVSLSIAQSAKSIELRIYDAAGRMVKDLSNALLHAPCTMQVNWNGRDDQNRLLASGIYFIKLKVDDLSEVKKVTIIR